MFKKGSNLILLIGVVLIALRLLFPVLQCNYRVDSSKAEYDQYCKNGGLIIFFTINQPRDAYQIHTYRTNTEATVIALVTVVLYLLLRQREKSKHSKNR